MPDEIGILKERYQLHKKIGQGGFAQVFLATDQLLLRPVAVKILNSGLDQTDDFLTRFRQEAQTIAKLSHPNILPVFDYGETQNTVFLVMPYVGGGTLFAKLQYQKKFTLEQTDYYLQQIAAAVDYAHRQKIVHRDLKPHNILLQAENNHLLLADFGIAKILGTTNLQTSTRVVGTLAYMAPEQFEGKVSNVSDIYSLGCVLFQLLTGELPYRGTEAEVIAAHRWSKIPSIIERSRGSLPLGIEAVIEKALAKSPEERFQTAGELAKAFHQSLLDKTTKLPPLNLAQNSSFDEATRSGSPNLQNANPSLTTNPPPPTLLSPANSGIVPKPSRNSGLLIGLLIITISLLIGLLVLLNLAKPAGNSPFIQTSTLSPPISAFTFPLASGTVSAPAASLTLSRATTAPTGGQEQAILRGHNTNVYGLAFSPDGKLLASASWDKTIKLWEVSSGKVLTTLSEHSDRVNSVAFSPDGKLLASGSKDNTVKLWEVSSGKLLANLTGHSAGVVSVSFSPDGKLLASGSEDKTLKLWEMHNNYRLSSTFSDHTDSVLAVAFSPDSKTLASASADKTIKLWEVGSAKLLGTLVSHTDRVNTVSFSPDGQTLASGSQDNTIKLWEVSSQKVYATLKGHTGWVRTLAFSPDGTILASGSSDFTIKLWQVNTGKELATLNGHVEGVLAVAFSPDGTTLASGSDDKTIRFWHILR